jgi:hypothetical protein
MTRNDIVQLNGGLISVADLRGVKFSYAVAKNKSIIKAEIEALEASVAPSEGFVEFNNKRIAICMDMCAKDDDGQPIIVDGNYTSDDEGAMMSKVKELQEEYKDVLSDRDDQLKRANSLLEEEIDINLYKVSVEYIPEDITPSQMESIFLIIEE